MPVGVCIQRQQGMKTQTLLLLTGAAWNLPSTRSIVYMVKMSKDIKKHKLNYLQTVKPFLKNTASLWFIYLQQQYITLNYKGICSPSPRYPDTRIASISSDFCLEVSKGLLTQHSQCRQILQHGNAPFLWGRYADSFVTWSTPRAIKIHKNISVVLLFSRKEEVLPYSFF